MSSHLGRALTGSGPDEEEEAERAEKGELPRAELTIVEFMLRALTGDAGRRRAYAVFGLPVLGEEVLLRLESIVSSDSSHSNGSGPSGLVGKKKCET